VPVETDNLSLGVALFPKFGVGGRKGSLPPDCFLYLVGYTLKTLQIPGRRGERYISLMCWTPFHNYIHLVTCVLLTNTPC
jgi:hypothetical protein